MRQPYGFMECIYRHHRAGEHLADIERLIEAFRSEPREVGTHFDAESWQHITYELRDVPISEEIPIRIGEMVYNLRGSMDYLVFALAWHDTGIEPSDEPKRWGSLLQFPLEDREEFFERRRDILLKGLSDEHVAMVEEYQPYCGVEWTKTLVSLSNSDKHRHFTVLAGRFEHELGEWTAIAHPKPEAVPDSMGRYDPDDVYVYDYATLDVALSDGRLVAETLQELQEQVRLLLYRFVDEFRLRPL